MGNRTLHRPRSRQENPCPYTSCLPRFTKRSISCHQCCSIHPSFGPPTHLSVRPPTKPFAYPSTIRLSIRGSVNPPGQPLVLQHIHLSIRRFVHPPTQQATHSPTMLKVVCTSLAGHRAVVRIVVFVALLMISNRATWDGTHLYSWPRSLYSASQQIVPLPAPRIRPTRQDLVLADHIRFFAESLSH